MRTAGRWTALAMAAWTTCGRAQVAANWGIDACLTRHVSDAEFPLYEYLLQSTGIRMVRERDVGLRQPDGTYTGDVRQKFRDLKRRGFTVVAFVSPVVPLQITNASDSLPEDLRQVYALGQILRRDFSGLVDVWEMVGEPDIGYCHDLPERVAAYQKALYLGLKTGDGPSPEVLMGALALPPGPWLERAAANGLLDYTDAYNFHYYGRAKDMAGVIRAHRRIAERWAGGGSALPIWITECGIKTVSAGDFLRSDRRVMQADFTVSTAREARSDGVAVFMPFVLVNREDPFALTLSPTQRLPAWNAYAALTRNLPWPHRPLARSAIRPSPVVMQWIPDPGAAVPHKVSGTYRFYSGRPMSGEIRIYNFGSDEIKGRFEGDMPRDFISTFPRTESLTVGPHQLSRCVGPSPRSDPDISKTGGEPALLRPTVPAPRCISDLRPRRTPRTSRNHQFNSFLLKATNRAIRSSRTTG